MLGFDTVVGIVGVDCVPQSEMLFGPGYLQLFMEVLVGFIALDKPLAVLFFVPMVEVKAPFGWGPLFWSISRCVCVWRVVSCRGGLTYAGVNLKPSASAACN